eukprot:2035071-Rhodomonas_salina.1
MHSEQYSLSQYHTLHSRFVAAQPTVRTVHHIAASSIAYRSTTHRASDTEGDRREHTTLSLSCPLSPSIETTSLGEAEEADEEGIGVSFRTKGRGIVVVRQPVIGKAGRKAVTSRSRSTENQAKLRRNKQKINQDRNKEGQAKAAITTAATRYCRAVPLKKASTPAERNASHVTQSRAPIGCNGNGGEMEGMGGREEGRRRERQRARVVRAEGRRKGQKA